MDTLTAPDDPVAAWLQFGLPRHGRVMVMGFRDASVPIDLDRVFAIARREDFRIVHVSIQRTHVHLLVEARHKQALASGMQGFQISAAKHLNAAISQGKPGPRRRGTVFPDRYHAEIITSPRQARHTLKYVLGNWRKHQEDRAAPMSAWTIDWFSSAAMFPGWAEYGEAAFLWRGPETYDPLVVYQPKTWLLREGWKKAGSISVRDVPSAKQ